jgi:hypothetical protein
MVLRGGSCITESSATLRLCWETGDWPSDPRGVAGNLMGGIRGVCCYVTHIYKQLYLLACCVFRCDLDARPFQTTYFPFFPSYLSSDGKEL